MISLPPRTSSTRQFRSVYLNLFRSSHRSIVFCLLPVLLSIMSRHARAVTIIPNTGAAKAISIPFSTSMRKAHIYFVRHGETEANRAGVLQGHCDYPLTDLGEQQAIDAGLRLKDMKWDRIYASDLPRALNTCKSILKQSKFKYPENRIMTTYLVRELSFGVREALPRSVSKLEATEIVAKRLGIPVEDVIDTAESTEACRTRQLEFMGVLGREIKHLLGTSDDDMFSLDDDDDDTNNSNSNNRKEPEPLRILCVTHGGFIKKFLGFFTPKVTTPTKIGNCALSVVEIEWPFGVEGTAPFLCRTHASWVNTTTASTTVSSGTTTTTTTGTTSTGTASDIPVVMTADALSLPVPLLSDLEAAEAVAAAVGGSGCTGSTASFVRGNNKTPTMSVEEGIKTTNRDEENAEVASAVPVRGIEANIDIASMTGSMRLEATLDGSSRGDLPS